MRKEQDIVSITIYFLTAFLPFYAILRAYTELENIQLLNLTINYFRDFVILSCFFIFALKTSNRCKDDKNPWMIQNINLGISLLLINYLYGFIISIFSGYYDLAIKGIHLNVIPILLVYVVSNSNYINGNNIRRFIRVSLNLGIIVSIIGLFFYVIRPDIFGQLLLVFSQQEESNYLQALNYSRMVSTFLSPNVLGSYMAISLLLSINEIINNKDNKVFLLNIFSAIMFGICLILTFSRGAWAFALVGTMILIIANKNKISSKLWILLFIVIIATVIIIPYLSEGLEDYLFYRLISVFDISNESAYGRIENWVQVIDVLSNNILGLGLGIASINLMYYPELAQSLGVNVVDGYYIKVIAETGIVGIILFCLFVIIVMHSLLTAVGKYKCNNRDIHIVTLAIFSGFLIQSFGSNIFDYVNLAPFLWIYLGFSIKASRDDTRM